MLTPEQKAAIRAEEVFRAEIRNEIASAGRLQKPRRKVWEVLNSSFAIWFLTSVVVALISYLISNAALNRERVENQRRLKWEVYNNGLEFEHAYKLAWTRLQYETAFSQHLQYPNARVVDLTPFTFDRITFDLEHFGPPDGREAATDLRRATHKVWEEIESAIGGKSAIGRKNANYYDYLDWSTKTQLDERICPIVQDVIIKPFNPYPNEAQPTAIPCESPIQVPQTPSPSH
jgi:hypothetical protein